MLDRQASGLELSSIRPHVFLNHLLLFVDKATYIAIAESPFLREEFAWNEERTTADYSGQSRWKGCYFYGNATYFEFMDPEETTWKPLDGVAFGVDGLHAGRILQTRLQRELRVDVHHYVRSRLFDDRPVNWFYMIERDHCPEERLLSWIMEYHPEFLQTWAPDIPPHDERITRRAVLEKYRRYLSDNKDTPGRYFKDILSVTLALPEFDANRLIENMTVYDYKIHRERDTVIAEGPDIRIEIRPGAPPNTGIRAFTMSLNRPKTGQQEYRFGSRCVLTFHADLTAEWRKI